MTYTILFFTPLRVETPLETAPSAKPKDLERYAYLPNVTLYIMRRASLQYTTEELIGKKKKCL